MAPPEGFEDLPEVLLPGELPDDLQAGAPADLPDLDQDFFAVMSELPSDFEEQLKQSKDFLQDIQLENVDPDGDLFDFDDEVEPVEREMSPDEICDGGQTAYAFEHQQMPQRGQYGQQPRWGNHRQQYTPAPQEFYKIMGHCKCDSNVYRVDHKFSQLEKAFDHQIKEIRRLESNLKSIHP